MNGANALSISAGHAIDILCFCVDEFAEVSAQVTTQLRQWRLTDTEETVEVTSPDNVLVSGVLRTGAVASVHVGSIPWHGSGWRLEVYGTEGTLVASSQAMVQMGEVDLRGARGAEGALEELPIPERLRWVPEGVPAGAPFNVPQMYQCFAYGLRARQAEEPAFALALTRHRLLDAIERASETGLRQRVTF